MALITVVAVSLVMASLLVVALQAGEHAARTSARGRNFDLALAVAEAGVHQAIAKIQASNGSLASQTFSGSTPQGTYTVEITRGPGSYTVRSAGSVGGSALGRRRVVRVTLEPPRSFPGYALFSNTSIDLKNLDEVTGDVWANDSVRVDNNNTIRGSVTAARGWVDLDANSSVQGDVWAGGTAGGWGIRLANGAEVRGNAKASVSSPSCAGETPSDYDITLGSGSRISGDATTYGKVTGAGTVGGTKHENTCTGAAAPKPLPAFTYNPNNYRSVQTFSTASAFNDWLASHASDIQGVFYVSEPSPSQVNRITFPNGARITGDTTIVTEAPVFTNGVGDGPADKVFVLVSHYKPPAGSSCSVNKDDSECAVHIKNNFQTGCHTAVLIYADHGPVAVKNNAEMCGAIYADSILVKNNQQLRYHERIARVVGFGDVTYEITRWAELAAT